jgi:hypothetical protein
MSIFVFCGTHIFLFIIEHLHQGAFFSVTEVPPFVEGETGKT